MKTIAAINVMAKNANLDDDTKRDLYQRVTGLRSLREMSPQQLEAVRAELNAKSAPTSKGLTGPYAKKLQALWISGWNLGLIRDRRDSAMLAFVARQTGIENTRFLRDAADARKAVEALKGWLAREGGVDWSNPAGDHVAILTAQMNRIGLTIADVHLGANGQVWLDNGTALVSPIEAMQRLGDRVRAHCRKGAA